VKSSYIFGKEHVCMSRNDEVMVGRRKETKSRKIAYLFGYYANFLEFTRKWIPENLIFQLHPKKSPLIMDQLRCSLPKNVTTFHWKEDGIIHFCLSPNKRGVLAL